MSGEKTACMLVMSGEKSAIGIFGVAITVRQRRGHFFPLKKNPVNF
jgi:hypothetical protein